jgi:benzoate/toluate 1,2-dioxygenase alpha subunit
MQINELKAKIIDRPDETFKVHRSIYTDPEIFDLEIEHIWEGGWVYIAHESQISEPNDYLTTIIGRQPIILSRGNDNVLRGFINACPHRGATVCRKPAGKARMWVCPYHAWSFDNKGSLIGVKEHAIGGYPDGWSKKEHGLTPVPHVTSYHGFIFASLKADVLDIETHLAAAAPFVELFARQSPEGLEVLRGHATYTHRSNWKMQAENGVDGYHVTTVHASYFKIAGERARKVESGEGTDDVAAVQVDFENTQHGNYDLGNGHVMIWTDVPNFRDRPLGMEYDALVVREGELRAKWMAGRVRQVLIYPNLILFDGISTQLRSWRALAPDYTEVQAYCIAPVGEPQEARTRRIRQYEDFYSASGIATPDDLTEFESCQLGYGARTAAWQEFDRGMARRLVGPDEHARSLGFNPAVSASHLGDETLYHGEYRQWLKLLIDGLSDEHTKQQVA